MATNNKPGKFINSLSSIISWIIVHVFMRGTVIRLNSMFKKEDKEELMRLENEAEAIRKKLDDIRNKFESKQKIVEKIENEKIRDNNWIMFNKIDKRKEGNRNIPNKVENVEIVDRFLQAAIEESKSKGKQLEELKEKITYFLHAAKLITEMQKCSANLLSKELKLNKNNAYYIINKLEEAGFIVNIYGKRNQKVLVENIEDLESSLMVTDLNYLLDENRNEEIEV